MKKNKNLIILGIIAILLIICFIIWYLFKGKNNNIVNTSIYKYSSMYNFENISDSYLHLGVAKNNLEYLEIIENYQLEEYENSQDQNFDKYSYEFIALFYNSCTTDISFKSYNVVNNRIKYNFKETAGCGDCARDVLIFVIPLQKELLNDIDLENIIVERKVNHTNCNSAIDYKPVLYLYPENKTNITINFEHEEYLTTTYPKFNNSWQILAYPNGDLYDYNGKYYYALYWEEKYNNLVDFSEGFYVTKDNAIEFLEEKLSIIGLSDRERNEFIMYWLPILEQNEKNLVYFELTESKQKYNELIIEPKPDSLLRLTMHIKKVNTKTNIRAQKLETFERKGFTAIEWGGVKY